MRHTRDEVIRRTLQEFALLDALVAYLSDEEWALPVSRPETKHPWTVKDTLAHITHWKADVARRVRGERRPAEERGLGIDEGNYLIYERWHERTHQEVLAWHRQVQQELLAALQAAPDAWFSGREHSPEWPYDLHGHSSYHRVRDIEAAVKEKP